jgi:hypothetical protein
MKLFFLIGALCVSLSAQAQAIKPSFAFGFTSYGVSNPASNFSLDSGFFAQLGVEAPLNDDGLSLNAFFNYMNSGGGYGAYNYQSGSTNYSSSRVDVDYTGYQLGLGLRQRFLLGSAFRPYIEGGGLFGYHNLEYGDTSTITSSGPGAADAFKESESQMSVGYYGEVGADLDLAEALGLKVGVRYQYSQSSEFETLGEEKLTFDNVFFIFGLALRF